MPFPSQCPVCKALLAFPEVSSGDPIRCPSCDSRFVREGRKLAHISFTDYYGVLGIAPEANDAQIRKAIRARILEHHPDRNPGDPDAPARLRQVVQAKELLTDSGKRKSYDALYHARALPKWTGDLYRETYRDPGYAYPPEGQRAYFDAAPQPPPRAQKEETYENIDHLIDEIDITLMQAGVPINVGGRRRYIEHSRIRIIWGWIGALSLGLAGLLFGSLRGTPGGAAVLAILGGIVGWILTAFPGGLVVLAFFVARMFIVSFVLALAAAKIATGQWIPETFGGFLGVFNAASATGAIALGLWGIAIAAVHGRAPYIVHYIVHRQSALGAWIGALWAVFIVTVLNAFDIGPLHVAVLWWFLFFTVYLLVDTQVFGRTWILVHERR